MTMSMMHMTHYWLTTAIHLVDHGEYSTTRRMNYVDGKSKGKGKGKGKVVRARARARWLW
jgi:hypothetical protein